MRLIREKSYRRQPWKNGGGETIEIAVFPSGATVENFDWRISMARIEADAPFSAFANIDRTLTILDGQGIDLLVEGQSAARITGQPHAFSGDLPTSATLIDGPVTDLNVMTRRGKLAHRVSRFSLKAQHDIIVRSPVVVIYCQSGVILVEDDIAAPLELSAGNTLLIESRPTDLRFNPVGETELVMAEIGPI